MELRVGAQTGAVYLRRLFRGAPLPGSFAFAAEDVFGDKQKNGTATPEDEAAVRLATSISREALEPV